MPRTLLRTRYSAPRPPPQCAEEPGTNKAEVEHSAAATDTSPALDCVRNLWQNSRDIDAEICFSGGGVLKVHKLILSQCEFFRAAFTSGFKEGQSNVINLPEDDPMATIMMLKWLYGYRLEEMLRPTNPFKTTTSKESLNTITPGLHDLVKLWEVCDKYSLPGLQLCITPHFRRMLVEQLKLDFFNRQAWFAIKEVYASEIEIKELRLEITDALHEACTYCELSDAAFEKGLGDQLRHCPELAITIAIRHFD